MSTSAWISAAAFGFVAGIAVAADTDTRAGSCEDAKSQYEYFCTGKGDPNDIMAQTPIACNNAKKNLAAACEGVVEPDVKYQFQDKK